METSELLKKVRRIEIKTRVFHEIYLLDNIIPHLKGVVWHLVKFVNISMEMTSVT